MCQAVSTNELDSRHRDFIESKVFSLNLIYLFSLDSQKWISKASTWIELEP